MPENRFYIEGPLEEGKSLMLSIKESHHLRVMRVQEGDSVELINGKNLLAKARVVSLRTKELLIEEVLVGKKRTREFILCQALCESSRLDLLLEKCTELGAAEILLFPAKRSSKKKISAPQLARMQAKLISAMKQCGRLDLPKLEVKKSLTDFSFLGATAFYGSLSSTAPSFLTCLKEEKRLLFFVGPPSGFTEAEEAQLEELGAIGVRLHEQILRTETAAITAVALAMHY